MERKKSTGETASDNKVAEQVHVPVYVTESVMDDFWYALNKAAELVREMTEAVLLPYGLRRRHYVALRVLLDREPTQQELSDRIPVDRATMVKIVDELELWKLVRRKRDPSDRRAYRVALLAKGRDVVMRASRDIAGAEKKVLRNLSSAERNMLLGLSQKLLGWSPLEREESDVAETIGLEVTPSRRRAPTPRRSAADE